ncbi:sensor histidine kinase [uncultured Hymenobacter sp.]|uniref:sensor histidine kinase n=1 Tax=uncultured Hymenobacter sp. TaxID=170016 RepID=UPI0035CA9310
MFSLPAFLHGLVEASPQVFFAYDPAARQLLYLSAAAGPVLGLPLSPAGATAQVPALLARLHPDDQAYLADCWSGWLAGDLAPSRLELRLTRAGGPDQWLALTPYYPPADPATGAPAWLGGTLEDISTAKEYTQNADRFNAKKNATLEILSHDLAAPFALLQQLADYVADEVGPAADPTLVRQLAVMRTTCQDGVSLIRDFVDDEFLQSSYVALKRERQDLVAMLRTVLENYQLDQQLIAKRFTLAPSAPALYATFDYNKFQQVVNNLISNAIKFTPDEGHIEIAVAGQPDHLLLSVADDGIGIPAEHLPELFERFTPVRRPGLRGEKTTGLGLSIVKTIIELHQGRIWVESEEGRGTTFFVELPRE